MNSVQRYDTKMDTRKSNTSDTHRLLSIYYTWKNVKKLYKNKKFKYQPQDGIKNLNCLMDHILYQIFKIISTIY